MQVQLPSPRCGVRPPRTAIGPAAVIVFVVLIIGRLLSDNNVLNSTLTASSSLCIINQTTMTNNNNYSLHDETAVTVNHPLHRDDSSDNSNDNNISGTTDRMAARETVHPAPSQSSYLIPDDQLEYCTKHNFLHVGDGPAFKSDKTTVPFSITKRTFQRHHDRYCVTSTELINAIQWGRRQWLDGVDNWKNMTKTEILYREHQESFFVPNSCDIPYLSTSMQYCEAANLFSDIVLLGDSQSRHMQSAMLMSYRHDYIKGGNHVDEIDNSNKLLQHQQYRCLCDSQVSESKSCRNNNGLFENFRPFQLNMCPSVPVDGAFQQRFVIHRFQHGFYDFADIQNCSSTSNDSRGLLLYLQGGTHVKNRAHNFWHRTMRIILRNPVVLNCAKERKLYFVWSTYTAQSPLLDEKYPHQTLASGLTFDREMTDKFVSQFGGSNMSMIPKLSWINMTIGSRTSDGLHFLVAENVLKAQHFMVLAKMLKQENKSLWWPGL